MSVRPALNMDEIRQEDSLISRDRVIGPMCLGLSAPLALLVPRSAMSLLFELTINAPDFGASIGLGAGVLLTWRMIERSIIHNKGITSAFVAVDSLASLLGKKGAMVSFGPGLHICPWWYGRSATGNANLREETEEFLAVVQLPFGKFMVKYEARLRPDITRLHEFVGGAGSVAGDLGGIISAFIATLMNKKKSAEEVLGSLKELNTALEKEFKYGRQKNDSLASDFEKRFGVIIGDVTAKEVLTTTALEETLNAISESLAIDKMVAASFGCKDAAELQVEIREGRIPAEEANRRRTQAMASSGNLQGMELKEGTSNYNINLSGLKDLHPDAAKALATGIASVAAAMAASSSGPQSSKPKGQPKKGGGK